jgi:general secretion pathway protein D
MKLTRIILLLALGATSLAAQRGGRRLPPAAPAPKLPDTTLVRKTPDGFVLDFENQPLNVVLSAVAEAGGLNVTFSNLPVTTVTLRMGQAVTKEQATEILKGIAAANELKVTETPSLIRLEGPPRGPTAQQQQQTQQQQQQLRLYTYRLKHANSTELAPVLMSLLTGTGTATQGGRAGGPGGVANPGFQIFGNPGNQTVVPIAPGRGGGGGAAGGGAAGGGAAGAGRGGGAAGVAVQQGVAQALAQAFGIGPLSGSAADIRIVAEESTNSLLVRATEADWALIQSVLTSVDLRPLQVLIEVTIAEVERTHDLNVGIAGNETRARGTGITARTDTTAFMPSTASARDFIYQLTGGKGTINYQVALNALQTRGDVKVLSLPVIISQNNKQAVLNVGSSVPFIQVSQTSGIDPTGRVQTVQYQDVGKTLTITPTINPDGYVNLALKQTDNTATNNVQFNAPVITKREATTQIFIRDGQTTVIGGLADNQQNHTKSGIPILSQIPWIGALFGNHTRNDIISELYVFLTPHIVSSDEDIDRLREAIKGQSELLREMNVDAKIVPKGDTIQIGTPAKPKPDSTTKPKPGPAVKPDPDSAAKPRRPDTVRG